MTTRMNLNNNYDVKIVQNINEIPKDIYDINKLKILNILKFSIV